MQTNDGYLSQVLLPLRDNAGVPFADQLWSTLKDTLTTRFGGVTAYNRAPAEGIVVRALPYRTF